MSLASPGIDRRLDKRIVYGLLLMLGEWRVWAFMGSGLVLNVANPRFMSLHGFVPLSQGRRLSTLAL